MKMRIRFSFLLSGLLALWMAGCATPEEERRDRLVELKSRQVRSEIYEKFAADEKLTLPEVIYLVKHGVDDDTITDEMEASHAVYRPTKKEVEDLCKAGVSYDLLEFIVESGGGRLVNRAGLTGDGYAGPYIGVGSYYYDDPFYGGYDGGYGYGGYRRYGGGYYDRGGHRDHDEHHSSRFLPPDPIREHVFN